MLMRSVSSADKTPHTNKEEVYRYKVTACDVLSTILFDHLVELCCRCYAPLVPVTLCRSTSYFISLQNRLYFCVIVFC